MTIYDLKPQFQNLLRPMVRLLWRCKITPNQVTLFTCLLSVAVGIFLYHAETAECFLVLPFFFFFRMAMNAIDGMLAKEFQMQTKLGALLNEVTDVLSDAVLYYAFSSLIFVHQPLLHTVILLAALSEITGLAALLNGKPRCYAGPSGKSDRAFIFSIMGIMVGFNLQNPMHYNLLLAIVALLLVVTIINRMKKSI